MKELCVVVDVSGSMCTMGKPSVLNNVMQTLSTLQNFYDKSQRINFSKMQWDGSKEAFEHLVDKMNGKNILLLTDGYALSDACRASSCVKKFIATNKSSLFVVLCGGDALDVSVFKKDFENLRVVKSCDILYAVECLYDAEMHNVQTNDSASDKDSWE